MLEALVGLWEDLSSSSKLQVQCLLPARLIRCQHSDAMHGCLAHGVQCTSMACTGYTAGAQRTGSPASPPQATSTRTSLPRGLCSSAATLPAAASASAWPSDSSPCPQDLPPADCGLLLARPRGRLSTFALVSVLLLKKQSE